MYSNIFKLLIAFLLLGIVARAQVPNIKWARCYGGSSFDNAKCVRQTSDGGYILTGTVQSRDSEVIGFHTPTDSFAQSDIWVVKTNDTGAIEWSKALGGGSSDYGYSVEQTPDGGYIVAGEVNSDNDDVSGSHGLGDAWVVKLTATGSITWQKCFGGSYEEGFNYIQPTTDGGYIATGYATSGDGQVTGVHLDTAGNETYDIWVVKMDDTGGLQWQKALGGSGAEYGECVRQTTDGGYVVVGYTSSNDGDVLGAHGSNDGWIVKLSSTGSIEWQTPYGGSQDDVFQAVRQTMDGGYILAGYSMSNNGDLTGNHLDTGGNTTVDVWLVKLFGNGHIDWQQSYGGSHYDEANDVEQTADSGYIMAGFTSSNDGDVSGNHGPGGYLFSDDFWVVKVTAGGMINWQKCIGGTGWEEAASIQQTSDAGYIVAGTVGSNNLDVSGNHGQDDYWAVKLYYPESVPKVNNPLQEIEVYPNPSSGNLTIEGLKPDKKVQATLYNIIGEQVEQVLVDKRNNVINIDNQANGTYILQLIVDGNVIDRKVVIAR